MLQHGKTHRESLSSQQIAELVERRLKGSAAPSEGDVIAIEARVSIDFVVDLIASLVAGALVAPLPALTDGKREGAAFKRLASTMPVLRPTKVIGSDHFRAACCAVSHAQGTILDDRTTGIGRLREPSEHSGVVQFTSGSTSAPKGCVLSQEAIRQNLAMMREVFSVTERSIGLSWLPLHHDMGLFGALLMPLATPGMEMHLMPTERFIVSPRSWLRLLAQHAVSICPIPGSTLALLDRLAPAVEQCDLSALETLIVGAEPIDPRIANRIVQSLLRSGADAETLRPAYGMAEATLLVSASESVSTSVSTEGRPYVRLGPPAPGVTVRFATSDDQEPSRITVDSPSLMSCYLDEPGRQGPLVTNDLGYMDDGEVVVVGRSDDVVIVAGQNIHPVDVEWELQDRLGTSCRSAVIVQTRAESNDPGVHVLVEVSGRSAQERHAAIEADVRRTCLVSGGFSPSTVSVLRPGTIPRTTSGKPQRRLAGALVGTAGVAGGST